MNNLRKTDLPIFKHIQNENKRQKEELILIPSENYASRAVLDALGSVLTNKYSEGYPGKRYYGGNENIDEIEDLARKRAMDLFKVPYVNVQAYSGSPANLAVCFALLQVGDAIMGLNLPDGGHLTHGWKLSFSGKFYKSVPYHVTESGSVDLSEVRRLAKEFKPKLIWIGGSAYTRQLEFELFYKIADEVGAYLVADISHIAGLVVGGSHPSPVPFAHVITSTTHKTLRGPRGAMIMVTSKGLKKNPELPSIIDKAIIPGLQGGPHNNTTAAIAVCLKEASTDKFKKYSRQIVKNAKVLARTFRREKIDMIGGGTENHLLLLNLVPTNGSGSGILVQEALERAGISANKNVIPKEPSSAYYPSGLRLGTPAVTSRGMKEKEMERIGSMVSEVIHFVSDFRLPEDKEARKEMLSRFRVRIKSDKELARIKSEVLKLCKKFPAPGLD